MGPSRPGRIAGFEAPLFGPWSPMLPTHPTVGSLIPMNRPANALVGRSHGWLPPAASPAWCMPCFERVRPGGTNRLNLEPSTPMYPREG
jgi:hypothetical protein